jgi:hypothetical protein
MQATDAENKADAKRHGTLPAGERHYMAIRARQRRERLGLTE